MYPIQEEAKKIIATGDYKRIPVTMELNSDMVTPVMAVKRLRDGGYYCEKGFTHVYVSSMILIYNSG